LIDFAKYYRQQFQQDLLHFVGQIPIDGNKHYKKQEFSIQYFFLTPNYNYLNVVPADRQALFAIALFWTILVDQTVYSNYRYDYLTFQRKTRYPKFIGNCTAPSLMSSQCGHHQHPKRILDAINDFGDTGNLFDFDREIFKKDETTIKRTKVEFGDLLEKSKLTMKIEIKEYFENHLPTIDWTEFWDKCELEM
jgi:hypothetical protein